MLNPDSKLKIISQCLEDYITPSTGQRIPRYVCKCECGAECIKIKRNLKRDLYCSKKCPIRTANSSSVFKPQKNPYYKHPNYQTWRGMIARCNNKNATGYKYYGAKNISVCKKWLDSFEEFCRDMSTKPSKQHTIERIDNDKNYTKENCYWLHNSKQNVNKDSTKLNQDIVNQIRKEYIPRIVTQKMLALKYNVSPSTIEKILSNRIWKE